LTVTVRDILEVMEAIAPASLAEQWDNVGLQVGRDDWPVQKIRVVLDATDELVCAACSEQINLLITHHPLIFHPLKRIDLTTYTGKILHTAIQNKIAIFCAHTNLDSTPGGVNDILAEKLGLKDTRVLKTSEQKDANLRKLVVFVPFGYEKSVLDTLFECGAGKTAKYTHVSFRAKGVGTFRPEATARPFKGHVGETALAEEHRIEVLVPRKDLPTVLDRLRRVHPYEEMAYDVYTTDFQDMRTGLGRIGHVGRDVTLRRFAQQTKEKLGLDRIKVAGDPALRVKRAVVCSGSGRGLIGEFLVSDAEVYVSGDLGYHDGRRVEAEGRGLIDVGHFASEQLIVDGLTARLREALSARGYPVEVSISGGERDCFYDV